MTYHKKYVSNCKLLVVFGSIITFLEKKNKHSILSARLAKCYAENDLNDLKNALKRI